MNFLYTPFSTKLSSNAKETQLRLRSIFQWGKRPPPLWLLVLTITLAAGCGGLVSCIPEPPPTPAEPEDPTPVLENISTFQVSERVIRELLVTDIYEDVLDGLTQEQQQLLADLPAAQMPTQVWDVSMDIPSKGVWRDTLIPVAQDRGVTLYLALVQPANSDKQGWHCAGIALNTGEQAAYFPLFWDDWQRQPQLWVRDFDGDGADEAAVVLHIGHGTGVLAYTLYLFELDTMTYSVPDYSTLDIQMTCNFDDRTITLTTPVDEVVTQIPEYCETVDGLFTGSWLYFRCEEDQLFCDLSLNLSGVGLAAIGEAYAPIVHENGTWILKDAKLNTFT